MYASQWFLTLFTAKFPLCMVFHITDLLLCEVKCDSLHYIILGLMEELCDPHYREFSKSETSGKMKEKRGNKEGQEQGRVFFFVKREGGTF